MAQNVLSDSHDSISPCCLMKSSERLLKSPGYPRPDDLALSTDPRLEMDMASNLNNSVDDPGKETDMASLPIRDETCTSERGEVFTTVTPQAPAAAPNLSLSAAEEAQPNAPKQKRNRKRSQKNKTIAPPTLEDLFGIQSDAWTRFHVLKIEGNLDNIEIYDDLCKRLKDDFECFRRKDGSIIVDAKTERNAEEIGKLQQILDSDVSTSRDPQLNSVRGTILVPLSEFKSTENMEARILGHLQHQKIPASSVTLYQKTSRKKTPLICACITFESRTLPKTLRIGFEKVAVREDIPKPRQCRSCWRFGHPALYCRSPSCCPICGDPGHNLDSCPYEGDRTFKGHCPNCNEDGHTALSKKCNLYRKEAEVLQVMYKQGMPKTRARRMLEEAGTFSNISYARRTAQPGKASVPGRQQQQPHQQTPQQKRQQQNEQTEPTISIANNQSAEKEQSKNQEQHESATQQETPEERMSVLFSDDLDLFLSVETESAEQPSNEDPASQVLQRRIPEAAKKKRKNEEAFSLSPTGKTQEPLLQNSRRRLTSPRDRTESEEPPLSTSSPTKSGSAHKTLQSDTLEDEMEPPSPMSRVRTLDKSSGAIPKDQNSSTIPRSNFTGNKRTPGQKDGQHCSAENCGCHKCISELLITKNEQLTPGKEISKKLRELINKRKIHKPTPAQTHPIPCMCKTHLEKKLAASKAATLAQEIPCNNPTSKTENKKVSSLRSQFESGPTPKVDPRTGLPPPKISNSSDSKKAEKMDNKQNITVITSR